MTKIEKKLSNAYDILKSDSDRINVHEIVQEAMRDIKWNWATYKKYSDALSSMLGSVFVPTSYQERSERDYEWFAVNLQKVAA
jgi:hypothetical protein